MTALHAEVNHALALVSAVDETGACLATRSTLPYKNTVGPSLTAEEIGAQLLADLERRRVGGEHEDEVAG